MIPDDPPLVEPLGAQTASGLPYPSSSDPVAQGAAAIQALADALDFRTPRLSNYGTGQALSGDVWTAAYPTGYISVGGYYVVEYGGVLNKPEAYEAAIGVSNRPSPPNMFTFVSFPFAAGNHIQAHFRTIVYLNPGDIVQVWAKYAGPGGNPATLYDRYLGWKFNGSQGLSPSLRDGEILTPLDDDEAEP